MSYTYDRQLMQKKAFEFIYGCALQDATLQKAFKGEKNWIKQSDAPVMLLNEYILKVLNNEFLSQANHDAFFLDTANKICAQINNNKPEGKETDVFSFGNAQKLINITVKHTYTFCYHTHSLREGFRFCHCPLDSVMLENVWNLCKGKIDLGKKYDFCKAWGAEGMIGNAQPELDKLPERYSLYQNAIRNLIGCGDMFPIEFDYIIWKA